MRSVFAATSASEASAHRPERAGKGAGRAASRLATHLGRHLFLRGLDVSKLAGRAVSLGVELLPFAGCGRARRGRGERGWAFVSRARRTGNRVHPRRKTRARCDTTSPHTWRLRVALLRVCLEVAARTFLLQPRLFGVGVRLHDARRVFHSARRTETFLPPSSPGGRQSGAQSNARSAAAPVPRPFLRPSIPHPPPRGGGQNRLRSRRAPRRRVCATRDLMTSYVGYGGSLTLRTFCADGLRSARKMSAR